MITEMDSETVENLTKFFLNLYEKEQQMHQTQALSNENLLLKNFINYGDYTFLRDKVQRNNYESFNIENLRRYKSEMEKIPNKSSVKSSGLKFLNYAFNKVKDIPTMPINHESQFNFSKNGNGDTISMPFLSLESCSSRPNNTNNKTEESFTYLPAITNSNFETIETRFTNTIVNRKISKNGQYTQKSYQANKTKSEKMNLITEFNFQDPLLTKKNTFHVKAKSLASKDLNYLLKDSINSKEIKNNLKVWKVSVRKENEYSYNSGNWDIPLLSQQNKSRNIEI